jgi:hypothetical protein
MLEHQGSLQIEILKEGFEQAKNTVMAGLEAKSKFIEAQWQKELTESAIKRINYESEHIKACFGLMDAMENLLKAFEDELQTERVRYDMMCKYFIGMKQLDRTLKNIHDLKSGNRKQD